MFTTFVLAMLIADSLLWAEDYCDPNLNRAPNDPNGYRMREGRCEGLYIREVATGTALLIASLTEVPEDPESQLHDVLRLEWFSPDAEKPTRLRGFGLRRRQYYRMDTVRGAGQRRYEWPTPVLERLQITMRQLGIVAWTSLRIGERAQDVYLPLAVDAKQRAGRAGKYELLLVPAAELSEVFLTLAHADARGRVAEPEYERTTLGYGFYPAERPVPITIAGLKQTGLYRLTIAAALKNGGSSQTDLWFYVAGP